MTVRNADRKTQYGTNSAHKLYSPVRNADRKTTYNEHRKCGGQVTVWLTSVWHEQCTQTEVTACNYEVYINERDQIVKRGGQRMQKQGGNTTVLSP